MTKWDLFLECKNGSTYQKKTPPKNKKKPTYMIISIDAEKAFGKIQHSCMIKNTQQTRSRRKLPQHNKIHV